MRIPTPVLEPDRRSLVSARGCRSVSAFNIAALSYPGGQSWWAERRDDVNFSSLETDDPCPHGQSSCWSQDGQRPTPYIPAPGLRCWPPSLRLAPQRTGARTTPQTRIHISDFQSEATNGIAKVSRDRLLHLFPVAVSPTLASLLLRAKKVRYPLLSQHSIRWLVNPLPRPLERPSRRGPRHQPRPSALSGTTSLTLLPTL